MKRQPFCNFALAGVSLTDFGLEIPSPFSSLDLSNSQITSMTSWTLTCSVTGDSSRSVNVASFEALMYSAAQSADGYPDSKGIPVSFSFGWLDETGNVREYLSYQGWTINFSTSTNGIYITYKITGYASLSLQSSMPVIRIPALCGFVQPSAVVEAIAKATKATTYYQLDIDHNDAPTLVQHGYMTTSFNSYVRGEFSTEDDYATFPGLLKLSKSYNGSREATGLNSKYRSLSTVLNNSSVTPIKDFMTQSNTDTTPQSLSFSYWIDEPTMTSPGVIHYKSNAGLQTAISENLLQYGTSTSNILSLSGSYNGVAYNISNMNFKQVGFTVDGSGQTVVNKTEVVNSWSSTLANTFQAANIINDVNALATQFSGDFSVQIPGSVKVFGVAQPVSLLVMTGGTISPISGIYNIVTVSHSISNTFVTTLKIQRMAMSSANEVAVSQNILYSNGSQYNSGIQKTSNVISPYKVDFGTIYPTFEHMAS